MSKIESRYVTSTDGANIWAERTGDYAKPAIVFLPGFGFSSIAFERQFNDAKLNENLHLVRYDCRGHARSDQPIRKDAYTSKSMAEDFKAVCEAFKITHPVLAGWSYGGTISSDVCEHLGVDYLSGIIYLSGVPYNAAFMEVGSGLMGPTFHTLANPDSSATELSEAIVFLIKSCVSDKFQMSIETEWLWRGVILSQNPLVRPLLVGKEQNPADLLAAGARLPICILHGVDDKHIDVRKMEQFAMAKFQHAEFIAVDDAGHMSFYEHPERVNGVILDFMLRVNA